MTNLAVKVPEEMPEDVWNEIDLKKSKHILMDILDIFVIYAWVNHARSSAEYKNREFLVARAYRYGGIMNKCKYCHKEYNVHGDWTDLMLNPPQREIAAFGDGEAWLEDVNFCPMCGRDLREAEHENS